MAKKNNSKSKSELQKKAIRANNAKQIEKKTFPDKFPFWARLKISKNRTTLVIDEEISKDKKTNKLTDKYVHREATSVYHKDLEEIRPNPDKSKKGPMYLKSPSKLPKKLFKPHNKELNMPDELRKKYEKNNKK